MCYVMLDLSRMTLVQSWNKENDRLRSSKSAGRPKPKTHWSSAMSIESAFLTTAYYVQRLNS